MKLVDSGYEMVTGTWGEIDEGITDTINIKSMKMVMVMLRFLFEAWAFETKLFKGFYINKEYVSVEKDVEMTDTVKDRMNAGY